MSYQPLARKYRPVKFSDLVGQEAVAKALAGAIAMERLHPAMIFSGVRGIGKTTTARLLAKALNCENGPTTEPCGVCESCRAITVGSHEDVLEIDGASNNGVDEVRALKETVSYVAQRSRYKVYIIDEVHMLSTSAFNALLKTLEEPPPDVVFLFATTELQKVPPTVIGRCLTFHLKKMTIDTIIGKLTEILNKENIPYEPKALQIVAKEGRGSMRDALTFLDQVIAIGEGKVDLAALDGLVSTLSTAPYFKLLDALITKDARVCIDIVEDLDQAGVVFSEIVEDLSKYARHGFILKDLGRDALKRTLLELNDDELSSLDILISKANPLDLNRIFRTLMQCRTELDGSDLDRFVFENYLLEWCFDPGLPDIDSILANGLSTTSTATRQAPQQTTANYPVPTTIGNDASSQSTEEPKTKKKKLLSKSFMEELKSEVKETQKKVNQLKSDVKESIEENKTVNSEAIPSSQSNVHTFPNTWQDLVEAWKQLKPLQARKLEEVHPLHYSQEKIVIAVDENSMVGPSLLQPTAQKSLQKIFSELFGFTGDFSVVGKKSIIASKNSDAPVEKNIQNESSINSAFQEAKPIELNKQNTLPKNNSEPQTIPSPSSKSANKANNSQKIYNSSPSAALPNTILQDRSERLSQERQAAITHAKEHDLTKAILNEFSGTIVDIKITDSSLLDLSQQ
ncbi:MAG: DNA polymerase III subunit gamma/tau [Bdellovibrionota bacterium]